MSYLPVCPFCEHQFDDEQVWHGGDDCKFPTDYQATDTFDCPNCGKHLEATYDPVPHWDFQEVEEEA